jgi:hypothetical protein
MKKIKTWNVNLYMLNLALLITHEIDSAFWKEWDLFGLPGDIQGFLVINFILVLIGLIGLKQILSGKRNGRVFAFLLACAGIFAFIIHMYFILDGRHEFTSAVSVMILTATFIVSLLQGIFSLRLLNGKS